MRQLGRNWSRTVQGGRVESEVGDFASRWELVMERYVRTEMESPETIVKADGEVRCVVSHLGVVAVRVWNLEHDSELQNLVLVYCWL